MRTRRHGARGREIGIQLDVWVGGGRGGGGSGVGGCDGRLQKGGGEGGGDGDVVRGEGVWEPVVLLKARAGMPRFEASVAGVDGAGSGEQVVENSNV